MLILRIPGELLQKRPACKELLNLVQAQCAPEGLLTFKTLPTMTFCSELSSTPNHFAKTLVVLSYGEAEGLSPGTLGGRDRAAHELDRVRKPGTGD
jgi:hypothetical protein